MLESIFGNESAEKALLHIFHYSEIHASAIAKDYGVAINPLKKQLERFESGGILNSKLVGKTRVFSFNEKSVWSKPVKDILEIAYNSISIEDKQQVFGSRRRPRRTGKPIL